MTPSTHQYQDGRTGDNTGRVSQIRRDNDVIKISKISLFDIDYAIYFHLAENVKPRVNENTTSIPVPVMFANGEKWSQIRKYGFLRDNNKKVLAPIIMIRRTNVTNDERLPIPGLNLWTPQLKLIPYKNMGMKYDRISGQYQRHESIEYYLTDIPSYVRLNYELLLWTDLQEQMNGLVESIIAISDNIWGDYYKFRTNVQDVTHDNVNVPGEDRLVKSTVTLQVDGYLRNAFDYHESNLKKQYSIKTVKFLSEGTEQIIQDDPSLILGETNDIANRTGAKENSLKRQLRSL